MPTLNYTTTISADKTLGEIVKALAVHGAATVGTTYTEGRPSGLSFTLPTPHGQREFALPVDVDAVLALLTSQKRQKPGNRIQANREQAERVAWRVLKDWLLAQLAMIEAQMVGFDQVMLPYLKVDAEHTLYDVYKENEQRAIEAGS